MDYYLYTGIESFCSDDDVCNFSFMIYDIFHGEFVWSKKYDSKCFYRIFFQKNIPWHILVWLYNIYNYETAFEPFRYFLYENSLIEINE